ncbi:hypothetical protein FS837_001231 [Tulasnella sp. UAMH 9824]|nr:hypothetical protein FS837_001231 [Tulasnella sp. UAMH 9824]
MADGPLSLATIGVDILLEIVQHQLTPHDLLSLRATCRALYGFTNHKAPWIVILKRLAQQRPLPISQFRKLSTLSLPELMEVSIKTSLLLQNWTSPLPEARPAFKMIAFSPSEVIVSILLIPHTPFVLTLSVGGGMRATSLITCVDTVKGKKVASYRSQGLVSSWRAETVSEGAIIIALLIGPEDRATISPEIPAHYNVLRLTLPNAETFTAASFKGISSHLITSPITGMFLTTEVAGLISVIRATQTSGLLMTRFTDNTTAHVDSGVSVTLKPNLNTIANQADLILYSEDNVGASAYAYSFEDDLFPLFSHSPPNTAQRLVFVPPSTAQNYRFHTAELCEGCNNAYTILRTRWKDIDAAKIPVTKPGHSEISVLSMAFVLGADPSGRQDHRCISHMYLDPFKQVEQGEDGGSESSDSGSVASGTYAPSPGDSSPRSSHASSEVDFPTSSALASQTPSPSLIAQSEFGGSEKGDFDNSPVIRRTFHSCLEEKREIWQGPSRNDLISVGLGASHAVWLAAGERPTDPAELKLASFEEPPFPLPLRPCPAHGSQRTSGVVAIMDDGTQVVGTPGGESSWIGPMPPKAIRTLKLPMSIHPHEISALALDDANGVIALATTRSELWLLDYAVAPTAIRGAEFA